MYRACTQRYNALLYILIHRQCNINKYIYKCTVLQIHYYNNGVGRRKLRRRRRRPRREKGEEREKKEVKEMEIDLKVRFPQRSRAVSAPPNEREREESLQLKKITGRVGLELYSRAYRPAVALLSAGS